MLNDPFDRTRAILGIIPDIGQKINRFISRRKLYVVFGQHFFYQFQLKLYHIFDLIFGQRFKHDDFVNPVKELRTNALFQQVKYLFAGLVQDLNPVVLIHLLKVLLDNMRPDIRGHDDDGILEIYRTTLVVGQPAIIQNLQ